MANENGLIGRLVAGAGGAALAVSVFLTWYSLSLADILRAAASQLPGQISAGPLPPGEDLLLSWSGWHGVHTIRFVLLLIGLAVLAGSLVPRTTPRSGRAVYALAGGVLAAVLAAYRIQSPPGSLDISFGPFQFPAPTGTDPALGSLLKVHAGPWVALVGGALVAIGAGLELAGERAVPADALSKYPAGPASNVAGDSLTW